MTREDIIRLARESGWDLEWGGTTIEQVQNFATLVAAEEREACNALLAEIKLKCQDADRMWQVEDFIDEAIRARSDA